MATELAFCCGHCTKKMRVPVNFAGRKGMCPRCEAQFTIPTAEEIDEAAPQRLMVPPDAPPPKKASAGDDERTAHFTRSASGVATLASPGELVPFDPTSAMDYKHAHQSSGAHRATSTSPASARSFELDYFAEPTGEKPSEEIEEVEAADLEQVETTPEALGAVEALDADDTADPFADDPVDSSDDELGGLLVAPPLASHSHAAVRHAEILDATAALPASAAEIEEFEDDLVPLEAEDFAPPEHAMADDDAVDEAELAAPMADDADEVLEELDLEVLDAAVPEAEALEAEALEAEALESEVLESEVLESEVLESEVLESEVLESEVLTPVAIAPLETVDLDVAIAAGVTAMADGLAALDSNDLLEAIDTAEFAAATVAGEVHDDDKPLPSGPPNDVADGDDDDEMIEFDPDALNLPPTDDGEPGASGMGEDESGQWDGELAAPDLDVGASAGDVDLGGVMEDLSPPDLDLPLTDIHRASTTVETPEGELDVSLTQILDLNDIMEVEEIEPPPAGLDTMNPAQLLAYAKQLVQKGARHKPSPELMARLGQPDVSPDIVLVRGHLRARVGEDTLAVEDYLFAREKGKTDDASVSAIDRHEIDALLDQVNQFIDEEPARAANLLRGILAERPGYAKAHYFLGLSLLSCGEKPTALAELRTAAKLGYNVPELDALEYELELANLELLREKNPRMLLVKLPPFLARWSSSAKGYELLALALRSAGNRQSALEAYRKARTLGETSRDTDRVIYDLLVDLGRDDDAQIELEGHLSKPAPDPFWVRVKFDQHFAMKNHRESLDALCQLALFATDSLELQHNIRLMLASFEPMVAATALRKALTREPRHAVMSRLLADLLLTSGGYVEALEIYTQLLEADSSHAGILLCRATCWQMMMPPQPDRALADLRLAFP